MKFIKHLFLGLFLIVAIMLFQIVESGYRMYEEATAGEKFISVIDDVRDQTNYVTYDAIPFTLIQATVAVEDKRFFTHRGFDITSIARAAYHNLTHDGIVSGGSTITQQLAKNLYLTFEKRYDRKVAELMIALDLEAHFTKEEILELYINVINYGDQQMGIYNAAEHYFNKSIQELTDAEMILLAGLPQSPNYYSLTNHADRAIDRSEQVLAAMLDNEQINLLDGLKIREAIQHIRSIE